MEKENIAEQLLERIEKPLPIKIPEAAHCLPTKKEQLQESLQICEKLTEEHASNGEALNVIAQEKEWLEEGLGLLDNENEIPEILLEKLKETASLNVLGLLVPANSVELDVWRYIIGFFDELKPSNKDIIENIDEYKEFIQHYDGNEAFSYVLQEITDSIYTKQGKKGMVSPADKHEVLHAYLISLEPDDFNDFTPETLEQIKIQQEGFDHLFDEFEITKEDVEEFKQSIMEESLPQTYEGPNEQAYDYVNQMYENLSYIDKEGNRWAASAKEVEEGFKLLNKAKKATQDSSDSELQDLITINTEHLEEANVRKFAGAWWLIVCAGILAIIELWSAFGTITTKYTVEQASSFQAGELSSLKSSLERLEAQETLTKDDEKRIADYKEEIPKLEATSAEDYTKKYNRKTRYRGLRNLWAGLISLAWIVGYYFASRPYGYDRFKRQRQYAIIKKATGWSAKILSGILGVFWSIPITTYITKYTDGSEERSSDALGVFAIQIIVTVLIVGMVLMIAKIIIPFATVIAYIRNYPGKVGAKQVHQIMGEGKGFAEKYIDKITGKNKAAA